MAISISSSFILESEKSLTQLDQAEDKLRPMIDSLEVARGFVNAVSVSVFIHLSINPKSNLQVIT